MHIKQATAQSTARLPYRDARLPVTDRVRDLLARMTLDEKFWQLFMIPGDLDNPAHDYSQGIFGLQITAAANAPAASAARAHAERSNAIQRFFVERTRLGIPIIPFDEALHGVMRDGAVVFPQAIGLAATWDSALVARVAGAIARETRSRGIRQVLSPVVNIAKDVRWGRVEETYGEDVHLTSVLGRAFVGAFERAGIITTPKHFIANVGDGGRDSYPIDFSTRLLEERFFPPFKTAIQQAGARSIMTAYNSVDGSPATQSRMLLNQKLKRDWGFTGFVISDAAATGGATVLHHTEASTATATKNAFDAGLDVIEPTEIAPNGTVIVRCTVTNSGTRAGDEVVQLYLRDVLASVARPVMELKGFTRVHLAPGEAREITFALSAEHLRMLDRALEWVVEPGVFRVLVGASSKDIRLRGELVVR